MNKAVKDAILAKIKEYNRIMLFRHIRIDGDCVGATKGLAGIIRATWPEKEVYIVDSSISDFLAFMGEDIAPISDGIYADSLGIVLDTASEKRISSDKYKLCRELIKIDHHIPLENYGNIAWVEEERSSCCEMIADFYRTFENELKLDSYTATHIYTGMVTDSGRFKHGDVTGETLRNAATLLDIGIDTEKLYSRLYLEPIENLKFKARVYEKMQVTENGVAYIYIDREMQNEFSLTFEQASAAVSMLDSVRGCICWIAFIDGVGDDSSIRVRLRSRFVTINSIAERYNGGGHACASGATVYSEAEMMSLIAEADAHIKEYKNTHEGWL